MSLCVRRYRNDPTIFAWNLINEPRCQKCAQLLLSICML